MIENATNLTNITNVTSASDGFISTMLHSQEFWIVLISLGGTFMYIWLSVWRPRILKSLKEVFNDVEIINDEDRCKYPQKPRFSNYPQARRYLKIHMAWGLWKKVGVTKKKYDVCGKKLYKKLASVFVDRCKNECLDFMSLTDGRGKSSMDYVIPKNVPLYLDDKNRGVNAFLETRDGDGKYCILYDGRIANTTSESKRNRLKALIESMGNDDEVKELFAKRDSAKGATAEAEGAFNKKLAKIVKNINYRAGGL